MRGLAVLLLVPLMLLACRAAPITPTVESMTGRYSWGETFGTSFGGGYESVSLELFADGSFQSSSWGNWGMSAIRLQEFGEAGSTGRWSVEGNEIRFVVDREPLDAAVSFDGSTARPTIDGLTLRSGRKRLEFVRVPQWTSSPRGDDGTDELWQAVQRAMRRSFPEPCDYVPVDGCALTSLSLLEGGRFVGGVWRAYDGCLSVRGNGTIEGTCWIEHDTIYFTANSMTIDIAFRLDDATGVFDGEDLLLRTRDGEGHRFTPGRNFSTELSED